MLPTPRIPPKYAALWSPGRIPPLSPPGAFFFVGIRQTLVVQRDPALASRGQLRRAHDAIPLHGVEAREPRLLEGGHVGQQRMALSPPSACSRPAQRAPPPALTG